ncbi:MAG: hypothetical protein ACFFAI_02010 [Promethearchaeota archaeon]
MPENNQNQKYTQEKNLNINDFTKDNYTEILKTPKYGLGNITIDDINFNILITGFLNQNVYHPLILNDLLSGALTINTTSMEFINCTSSAIIHNLDPEIVDDVTARVTLNETLHVEYNNSTAKYLIYHARFTQIYLLELYVNNGTEINKLTENIDYTIDERQYIVFYYEDYFQEGNNDSFDMYIIWDKVMPFGDWKIEQLQNQNLEINEAEQEIVAEFQYSFHLIARLYTEDLDTILQIYFWDVALTVNPLDKEKFNDHKLMLMGTEANIGTHLNPDKSIKVLLSDQFTPNNSTFSLNFTCSYMLKFEKPVGSSWAIDRLIDQREIREKIYFSTLLSGPEHIYLKNVEFYEPSLYVEEVLDTYSLFNRDVLFGDANASGSNRLGINVTIPFLLVGETCPFSIKYSTFHKLKIVITDNIKMPLVGAEIEVFYCGAKYGTYVSNTTSQPIIPSKSDGNGQIVLYNVPRGNYTIRVYWRGKFVKEASVSTYKEINYISTNVVHYPFWILVFGGINGIILIVGAIFYLKYKKLRK